MLDLIPVNINQSSVSSTLEHDEDAPGAERGDLSDFLEGVPRRHPEEATKAKLGGDGGEL